MVTYRANAMNILKATLAVILATLSMHVWGQDCSSGDPSGHITLQTQSEVDSFQADHGNGGICRRVTGDLAVVGGSITDIDGLSDLTSVEGDLVIWDSVSLTNTSGLVHITSVGGSITVRDNNDLTDIDGLTNLTSVGGTLYITGNTALTNINALTGLSNISGLLLMGNPSLTDLDGLVNITSAGGSFTIRTNKILSNIDGLSKLTSVSGGLEVKDNAALTDINGLNNLSSLGGSLNISTNAYLTNIDGLGKLTILHGNLSISDNTRLSSIGGLSRVTSVGRNLSIEDNPLLTSIDGLTDLLSIGDSLTIANNVKLTGTSGMANLVSVGGDLFIVDNTALGGIDSLAKLSSVGDNLYIENNPELSTLDGLASLTSATGVYILQNAKLSNIDGLASLVNVGGDLEVEGNSSLANCSALAYLLGWPDGAPNQKVGFITIDSNDSGCNSIQEILDDVSGPTAPVITSSEPQNRQATLVFSPAATSDPLWSITGYHAQCLSEEESVFQSSSSVGIPDENSVNSGLPVTGVPVRTGAELIIAVNITHPDTSELTLTLESPSGTSVTLWDGNSGGGENLVGAFPTTIPPTESLSVFDGLDFNGEWHLTVTDGLASQTGTLNSWGITVSDVSNVTTAAATSPVTLTGLTNNRTYLCTVSAVTGLGKGPASNEVSVTPFNHDGSVFQINAGLNDAWYYPVTTGQGFFITVFPDIGYISLSWFTYDTVRPDPDVTSNLGEPGHRWFNALGKYSGNQAVMNISIASDGLFDEPTEISQVDDGTITLTFEDCETGTVEYDIPSINKQGIVPIQRVAGDNVALCETLAAQATVQTTGTKQSTHINSTDVATTQATTLSAMNAGLNDAWYYPVTTGQGFFITVFPKLELVALSWFTYDTVRPDVGVTANLGEPGHRWLNALGQFSGNQAVLDISIASGGLFDESTEISQVADGTIILTFSDCENGTVEYDIPSIDRKGTVPIQRVAGDNIMLCETLNED